MVGTPVERKEFRRLFHEGRLFGRILKKAGVEGKSFHCLRHSFATRLSTAGVEMSDIARLIGHRSEETTRIYALKELR